ncbi:hypothetical protein [Streptomyces sp. ME19-01-6]|uniref:hypothetical protein n=1 Tax=Streptomyces sp. ME19-01-6 TaxID=3028686 RepID=UPI0029A04FDD|nr:hypothetical protein [Streptomyces sp. ME19-01-6]MDX3227930.1 hypothetical protein [Streptomyces sp. ME19-01-6]
MSGESGTFSQRVSRLGERRRAQYAPLFDGRPEVAIANTQLLPDQAIQLATAYGYRYARTQGTKSVRRRIFVPDPDPAVRFEALLPGTPWEVAEAHPAFHGRSARAARNHAAMIRGERKLVKLVPVMVVVLLGIGGMAMQAITTDKAALLVPAAFFTLLEAALVAMIWAGFRKQRQLEAAAQRLMRQFPPHGFAPH